MPVTAVRDEGALRMWVCRLPVHIAPADCTVFTEICGEFTISRWAGRVVGPYNNTALSVGADDSVRPQDAPVFTETFGEFTTAQRADVGIGPYKRGGKCLRIFRKAAVLTLFLSRHYARPRCRAVLCGRFQAP